MNVGAFLTDFPVADRIIHYLKLTLVVEKPRAPQIAYQAATQDAAKIINRAISWAEIYKHFFFCCEHESGAVNL
jgi:hypothetical protein